MADADIEEARDLRLLRERCVTLEKRLEKLNISKIRTEERAAHEAGHQLKEMETLEGQLRKLQSDREELLRHQRATLPDEAFRRLAAYQEELRLYEGVHSIGARLQEELRASLDRFPESVIPEHLRFLL